MTDEQLREFALDYVSGRLYTTQNVPKELWNMVFMPLGFAKKAQLRGVRMALANRDKHQTTGQAINGYPMFVEVVMLKQRDLGKFMRYVAQARNHADVARSWVKNGKTDGPGA